MTDLTIEEAERLVGVPANDWGGKCHHISCGLADRVDGKVHRGYAPGIKCHPQSFWSGGMAQHSWISLGNDRVLDPTRFTTEAPGTKPYLWEGSDDDYDVAGMKTQRRSDSPPDIWDTEREFIVLDVGSVDYIGDLLGTPSDFRYDDPPGMEISFEQGIWLANLPVLKREGAGILSAFFASEVYEALEENNLKALIPVDRWNYVMKGDCR